MGKLFFETPGYTEGKYLVMRRDGTIPPWPHFVLGGCDPIVPWALRAYAAFALLYLRDWGYCKSVWRFARHMALFRKATAGLLKKADPNARPHRVDDPIVVAEMRTKTSAPHVTPELMCAIGGLIGYARAKAQADGLDPKDIPEIAEVKSLYVRLGSRVAFLAEKT